MDNESPRLISGRFRIVSLILWVMVALAFLAVFVVDIGLSYGLMAEPCDGTDCHYQAIGEAEAEVLAGLGLPVEVYALTIHGLSALSVTLFAALAILMLRRLYPQRLGLVLSLMLIIIPVTAITSFDVVAAAFPAWHAIVVFLNALGSALVLLFFLIFPNGRLVPRWSLILVVVWVPLSVSQFIADLPSISTAILLLTIMTATVSVVVYRYRRVFNRAERQQTKWVLFGILIFFLGFPIWGYTFEFSSPAPGQAKLFTLVIGWTLSMLVTIALPMGIVIAILRSRLWDIDLIIRKTLVYGVVTALLVAVYFAGVVLIQNLLIVLIGQQTPVAIVVTTLLIAGLFNPLRRRVQDVVDRRFYRRKYDAEKTLARFAVTARDEVDLDDLTVQLLHVVQETMQPESVSIWLKE